MLLYQLPTVILLFVCVSVATVKSHNLSCYQCVTYGDEECDTKDLKPCRTTSDRCVIHTRKNAKEGLVVKRECGLAPCNFDDEIMAKGLGMDCDMNKDSFSCTTCCRSSGCNKNGATVKTVPKILLLIAVLIVCFLHLAKDFIHPYFQEDAHNIKK